MASATTTGSLEPGSSRRNLAISGHRVIGVGEMEVFTFSMPAIGGRRSASTGA